MVLWISVGDSIFPYSIALYIIGSTPVNDKIAGEARILLGFFRLYSLSLSVGLQGHNSRNITHKDYFLLPMLYSATSLCYFTVCSDVKSKKNGGTRLL